MTKIITFGIGIKTFDKCRCIHGINKLWPINKLEKKRIFTLKCYKYLHKIGKQKNQDLKISFYRHRHKRPARGQRTKTNAKTQKKN